MYGGRRGIGGSSGGGMLRTVGSTAARVGFSGSLQKPPPSASNTSPASPTSASKKLNASNNHNNLSVSPASSSFSTFPANAIYGMAGAWPDFDSSPTSPCCDEFDWVTVDRTGDEMPLVIMDDYHLGLVPSTDEVQSAIAALQQAFDPSSSPQLVKDKYSYNVGNDMGDLVLSPVRQVLPDSSSGSEQDWREPSFHLCMPQSYGLERVYDAFHLLRTEPTVQRMVVSLSSDQAVWDAVLNNEVVRELRMSVGDDSSQGSNTCSEEDNEAMNVVQWFFTTAKAKFMEVLEKVTEVLSRLFKPPAPPEDEATATDPFDGKLRTSFMLSVVVLLVVVVTRTRGA